uniref:obscurin-like protein 1 isoform X1 n=3 Tax=Podarcis muralis TaxID=64176 RepID=UPI00109F39A2|nr:obscurin-like protein 1 isoform X1 [Podarcis muralis]
MLGGRQAGPLTAPYEVPGLSCIPSVPTMDAFGGAPRFLTYPRTFTVPSGTNAVLKWQVAGEPRPSVAWEKDGSVLDLPSGRMLVEADGDAYSLLVYQAGPADSGRYVCKAKNSVGETYAAATLKVEAAELKPKGELDIQPPVFLNRPVSARVTRGEDVTFACRVSGELEWEKDGWKLSDIFESSHYKVGRETGDWHSLHIYNTRLPDAGVYVCRAQNSFGETMAAAVLLVDSVACVPHSDAFTPQNSHFKKQLEAQDEKWRWHHPGQKVSSESRQNGEVLPSPPTPKAFTVNEGKHAKFRCYVTGKPKPEIVWQKDGMVLSPGRRHLLYEDREGYFILKVLYCTARDCGLYVCTACNTAGQTLSAVSLHVKEPRLRFQAPLVDVEVLERQDAVLECQVPLETIPTAWYLEDKRLQPSPKYLMEEQGLLRRLTVRDARADDDGIYLCEMEGKGRSVGELSVQGLIVKRLPRKLDVMEGENAAFYVETREPVEAPSWGRNGQELVEAPHTLIRSFGKTHLLVLVHVTRHDAGVITFTAGESQTSAQLRVKCAKRIPPSAPVAARMCMSRNNAALLTWCPPPDVHRSPPSSYILERQAVGEAEWVPCLTTDVASMVEVPGDGVPQEADYRFRVCSANQYGCSGHVEFPGTVHLVPRARIQKGLQDVKVHAGEDATFSVQLSASQSGCWFFNGKRLEEEEGEEGQQYQITHSGLDHALRIKGVQLAANGSEVQFEANGVKECAALCVQAPQVHITPVPEARRHRTLTAGMPLLLECEVSIPDTPINWFKEGNPVALDDSRVGVQTEGRIHRLLISSVCSLDSGTYTCDAGDDAISFTVTVDEPPVRVVHSNAEEAHTYQVTERVVLTCELSHPNAPVRWYKDGEAVKESNSFLLESEGPHHHLVIPAAQVKDAGEFVCDIGGDSVLFNVTVTDPPVRILHSSAEETHAYRISERVVLACQLSRPDAPVRWYKDGEEVEESERLLLESEGSHRRLVIASAQIHDTGEFVCDAGGDSAFFNITITEPPVHVVCSNAEEDHTYQILECVTLSCELSRPDAPVLWYKDGEEVEESEGLRLESEGSHHRLVIASACVQDTGEFVCDAGGDSVFFNITVTEPPVRVLHSNAEEAHTYKVAEHVVLACELSRPDAPVCWYKDGEEVEESDCLLLESEGPHRRLVIPSVQMKDAGEFVCDAGSDSVFFNITVTEPPVQILHSNADASHSYQASERVVLSCVLSCSSAPVRWYKDGEEVEEGERLLLENEGPLRRLVLASAQVQDSGEFVCDTGTDSAFFVVTVAAPKVHIAPVSEAQCLQTILTGMPLLLECEVSASDATVQWFKDGNPVDHDIFTVQSEGCIRRLLVHSACPLDSGTYTCNTADDTVDFTVMVDELPVRVLHSNADAAHAYRVSERVVLDCELSCSDAVVCWYKDGEEVEEKDGLLLESEGLHRRLVIIAAQVQDTGEFACGTGGDTVFFNVTVTEPPVQILHPVERSLEKHIQAFECLELSCKVSIPNAPVRWFKDGLEVDETNNLLLQMEGAERRLVVLQAGAEDAGEYICETKDESVSFDVRVSEPPVKIVQPRRTPSVLKASTGETVTLTCVLSHGNAPVRWVKDGVTLEANSGLILEEEGARRCLVIPAAGPEHSGKYTCNAVDDTMAFAVQVSDPPVRIVGRDELQTQHRCLTSEDLTLSVTLSCPKGEVKWYKDGEKLQDTDRVRLEQDGACHSLVILGAERCDAGEYLCDSGDDSLIFYVTVEEPPISIVGNTGVPEHHSLVSGEALVLACKVSSPSAAVRWLRNGEELVPSKRVRIEAHGRQRQLTILGAKPGDSGSYVCDAGTDRMESTVKVAAPPVHIVNKNDAHVPLEVQEGENMTLVARLSQEKASVRWLKNMRPLYPGPRLVVSSEGAVRSLTIRQTEPGDSGTYTCDTGDDEVHFTTYVQEAPVLFVPKPEHPEKVLVLEGGSAVLSAIVSKEPAMVRWEGPRGALVAGDQCQLRREGRVHSLLLSNVGKADAGEYICHSHHDQLRFELSVKELPVKFVRGLSDVLALQGETVLFWCELCKTKGDVLWLKDGQELEANEHQEIRAEGRERSLTLRHVGPEDAGEYSCESKDDRTLAILTVQIPRSVEIISELHNLTVLEGDDATFKAVVSPDDVALKWQHHGQDIVPSERFATTRVGLCHTLTIQQCRLSDTGIVTVHAEGLVSSARLSVQEAQVIFVQTLRDLMAEEGQDVCLEVELSLESAEVQWMKQGILLQQNTKYSMEACGSQRTLTIHNIELADRGTYRCESLHDRTQARLSVEPRRVTVRKPLLDVETFEKETVTFELELSHANVAGVWTRDGIRVKPGSTCRVSATGFVHSLTLLGLTLDDSGTVAFTADTVRSSARLTVQEPPVTMLRFPQDMGIPETGSATFECELSRPLAEVKWYKDGEEIQTGQNCRMYSVGRRRLLQLSHCGLEDAGEYTCDAGDCRASAKLRVFERQVQIVRELEDVRVRENENAVFMCEVSLEEVKGEWFRDGERIKVSSIVKIRQEGTRHFLLLCCVRPEDSGQVRFVAKAAASEARLEVEALPIRIVKPLRDKTVLARHKATLECTVSQSRGRVRWFRGDTEIFAGNKYEICNLDCYRTLVIHSVEPADEGLYTCDALDDRSTARLLVEAEGIQVVRALRNVDVVAPAEARFDCEISAPPACSPQWSLNGEDLQPGSQVRMESMGHIHRLRLCQTTPGMSGMVKVTIGNARSKAHLTVRER